MAQTSNSEPHRFYQAGDVGERRSRSRCAGCGARGAVHSSDLPFCSACLEWTRESNLTEWDDLGGSED
jgi:hypothetical protein